MSKRSEYRRMMRALEDLDRVDAGKAPKRGMLPEVRSSTDRWVHGNTAKVASTYAKGGGGPIQVPHRRRRRGWVIALIAVLAVVGAIAASRQSNARSWDGSNRSLHRLLPAVHATTPGPYAFERIVGPDSRQPVRYDPCKIVDYTINSDLAPAGSAGIITSAVTEVSQLTGLEFRYVGASHTPVHDQREVPASVMLGDYPPVEIGWSSPADFASLNGDVVGFGGSTSVSGGGAATHYVTGSVALRVDRLVEALRMPGGRAFVKAVVLHELGHVLGLAHVKDSHELMNAEMTSLRDYGPGDRQGLALLGQGSCD